MRALVFPDGLELYDTYGAQRFSRDVLRIYSIVSQNDESFAASQEACFDCDEALPFSLSSSMGCLMGNAVGDALGAPLEFMPVNYEKTFIDDMEVYEKHGNKFFLKPGQWTDDYSMCQCIADSLLINKGELNAKDLRMRFLAWWEFGYNNAFAMDEARRGGSSVGLGGNISLSMGEFKKVREDFTTAGDENTSGNGSVMRNGAIPCAYWNDLPKAMELSYRQSRTTHQGIEAAECARLLTFICCSAAQKGKPSVAKELLDDLSAFESPSPSVMLLAAARDEEDLDRKWNWKVDAYRYAPTRAQNQPGYVGSYCMDAMAMALHCVWTTLSFREAALKCVNLCGDADSVGSVCCQIAGSIYGLHAVPEDWIRRINRWDNGLIALRGYKLYHKQWVDAPTSEEIEIVKQFDKQFYCSTVEVDDLKS